MKPNTRRAVRLTGGRAVRIARTTLPLLGMVLLVPATLPGQTGENRRYPIKDARDIMPREMGIDLPDGPVEAWTGNVTTVDEDGRGCVARVVCRVGEHYVVMLPDGRIVGRKNDDADPTDREFEPATGEQVGKNIVQDRLRGFQVLTTKHFVFVYNTTPEFAEVTSKVMESMLKGLMDFCEKQGIQVHEPEVMLPVIMFNREQQFQSYEPMPGQVMAYYQIASNRVILHEESSLSAMSNELARQQLLSTIAHEGAHQILHNIGVQQRLSRWPLWLGEGLAEYMAPTKPGFRFAWKGAGKVNDLRMWELERALQKQFINGFDGSTVDGTVHSGVLDSTGYAAAWTLTHYLAKNRKEDFDRYIRYLSRMPPLMGMLPDAPSPEPTVDGNLVHFRKFFGEDLETLENEMVKYMARQKYESPFGELPHLVALCEIPGDEGTIKHACFYVDEGSIKEWQKTVIDSLTADQQEQAKFSKPMAFRNRGEANRFIKKWKREK